MDIYYFGEKKRFVLSFSWAGFRDFFKKFVGINNIMMTNGYDIFDLETKKVLLDYFRMVPKNADSLFEDRRGSKSCDLLESAVKKSFHDTSQTNLTIIKKKGKVLMFRPSSTPSSNRTSSHSQNSHTSFSSQPTGSSRPQGDIFFDSTDGCKTHSCEFQLPTLEEVQAVRAYVEITSEESDNKELNEEIRNLQKEIEG